MQIPGREVGHGDLGSGKKGVLKSFLGRRESHFDTLIYPLILSFVRYLDIYRVPHTLVDAGEVGLLLL